MSGQDNLKARRTLTVGGKNYEYYSLPAAQDAGIADMSRLPFSLKVLVEHMLRHEDGRTVAVKEAELGSCVVDEIKKNRKKCQLKTQSNNSN